MKKRAIATGIFVVLAGISLPRSAVGATPPSPRLQHPPRRLHVIESEKARAPRVPFDTTPVSEKVFPREAYRDQAQPFVTSVLEQTPGALIYRPFDESFAVPNVPSYALVRGGLPYETPVAIDGAPVSSAATGTLDLALVPTYVLQEVEIVKGQGDPADLGGSANGAVNFQTAEPTAQERGMIEFEGDSNGGQFSDLAYDGTMPGGKFAYATMLSIDGSPGPLPPLGLAGNPASNSLRKALLVDLRATPSDTLQLSMTMLATNLDRGLAGAYGSMSGSDFVSLVPDLGARQDERLRFEQLLAEYSASSNDDIAIRIYNSDVSDDGYAGSLTLAQGYEGQTGAGVTWTNTSGPNQYMLDLEARGDADRLENDTSLAAFGEPLAQGSGLASTRARASATLHLTPGTEVDASAELTSDTTRIASGALRNWGSFDGRLGASQLVAPKVSLRASAGVSGVTPPLDALESVGAMQQSIGLPAEFVAFHSSVDSQESAGGGDVGLDWRLHGDTTTLSFDAYDTFVRNAYVLSGTQVVPGLIDALWSNAPSMRDEGVELSLVQFKPIGLGFIVQGMLPRTYIGGPLAPNSAGIPYAQGYGEISYKWPRGSRASIGFLYTGGNNPYERAGFATFNTNLELSLGSRSKVQISAQNLFGALNGRVPFLLSGFSLPVAGIGLMANSANVIGPMTVRVMFRQAFGQGGLYEH